jgi:hypothetical protein
LGSDKEGAMSFEELARRMNERAGAPPGMPVDVAKLQRKQDRLQAAVMIWGSLVLTAVSLGLNVWLAQTGWLYSAGLMLTLIGVLGIYAGVKQFVKTMRRPRPTADAQSDVSDR